MAGDNKSVPGTAWKTTLISKSKTIIIDFKIYQQLQQPTTSTRQSPIPSPPWPPSVRPRQCPHRAPSVRRASTTDRRRSSWPPRKRKRGRVRFHILIGDFHFQIDRVFFGDKLRVAKLSTIWTGDDINYLGKILRNSHQARLISDKNSCQNNCP